MRRIRQTDNVVKGPLPSSAAATARFAAQREKDTQPELLLRSALHRRGLRYRLHRRPLPDLRRIVDIVFSAPKVAVDVRGCFWHLCPEHRSLPQSNAAWWGAKLARNAERDRETEAALRSAGWLVIVVWEHEDPEIAAERVEACVRARRADGLSGHSSVCDSLSQC
jgi:DNA mismatch endonuclease, patch repair protein